MSKIINKKYLDDKQIRALIRAARRKATNGLCDELLIWLLITTGLKVPDIAKLKVCDVLERNGDWKDKVVDIQRFKGFGQTVSRFFIFNSRSLKKSLEYYIEKRRNKHYQCSFNPNEFKGLIPDSKLILNNEGKAYSFVPTEDGHEKQSPLHLKISKIFEDAKIKNEGQQYVQILYETFKAKLKSVDYTDKQAELICKGYLDQEFIKKNLTKIQKDIKKLFPPVLTPSIDTKPIVIFHYCSNLAFENIVSKKSLWFSDLLKMNDPTELIGNLDIAKNSYKEYFEEDVIFQQIFGNNKDIKILSCSFSQHSDDLNQWRSYAEDGTGIAIGFDRKKLIAIFQILQKELEGDFDFQSNFFNLEEVEYEKTTRKNLRKKLERLWQDLHKVTSLKAITSEQVLQLHSLILRICAIHKSNFFISEKEERAFFNVNPNGIYKNEDIDFRTGTYGLTVYMKIKLLSAISHVKLGPTCPSKKEDIYHFLKKNGVTISLSSITRSIGEYR